MLDVVLYMFSLLAELATINKASAQMKYAIVGIGFSMYVLARVKCLSLSVLYSQLRFFPDMKFELCKNSWIRCKHLRCVHHAAFTSEGKTPDGVLPFDKDENDELPAMGRPFESERVYVNNFPSCLTA